jgi:hypothetical protein
MDVGWMARVPFDSRNPCSLPLSTNRRIVDSDLSRSRAAALTVRGALLIALVSAHLNWLINCANVYTCEIVSIS